MKIFTLFISILFSSHFSYSQLTFQKCYGGINDDFGYSVQQTLDGGYIIGGQTWSFSAGHYDFYIIKTNGNGDTLWTKTFGGQSEDNCYSVKQTSDGGYILAGNTNSFGTGAEVYLIKTNSNGDLLWSKTYGGTGSHYGKSVQQTLDGGFIITGSTSFGVGANHLDVYLFKTDINGNIVWSKTFGGTYSDYGNDVQQTLDGGYIIVGSTEESYMGPTDVYLIKVDSSGNFQWTKQYDESIYDGGKSVQQTNDGGYVIGGYAVNSVNVPFILLIKTDSTGNTIWTNKFQSDARCEFVQLSLDGGYVISGYDNGSGRGMLFKSNANGNFIWVKHYGNVNRVIHQVHQTIDGGYIMTGYLYGQSTGADIYLIKTDSMGNSGCNDFNIQTTNLTNTVSTSVSVTVTTSPTTLVNSPTSIIGNGGFDSTLCSTVGIYETSPQNSFSIFPNPSHGNFVIIFSELISEGIMEIYNVLGERMLIEKLKNESEQDIQLKNVSDGIYFIKLTNGNKSYCKKLIIDHK